MTSGGLVLRSHLSVLENPNFRSLNVDVGLSYTGKTQACVSYSSLTPYVATLIVYPKRLCVHQLNALWKCVKLTRLRAHLNERERVHTES